MSKFFTRGMFPLHADMFVEGWKNPYNNRCHIRLKIEDGHEGIIDLPLRVDEAEQLRDALSDAITAAREQQ
jgi:hypothetical protein